jgi:predicted methyltransferase
MSHAARLAGLALVLSFFACAEREAPPPAVSSPAAATQAGSSVPTPRAVDYEAALAAPGRLADDRAADESRKPREVLAFFGVQPGMTVLDLYSGGGYWTELLSTIVGPMGRVVAHNNSSYLNGAAEELSQRFADPQRLANVERLAAENNALELAPGRFDFVLLSNVYHDVYFVNEARGWAKIDGPMLLGELNAAMKPGAKVGVIDHAAPPGSPAETGGTLHRIDPAIVQRDFEAAGFVLEAQSDALRNSADDFSKNVFDPAVRGRTDRFIMRFRRP